MLRDIPARRRESGKGSIDLAPDLSNLAAATRNARGTMRRAGPSITQRALIIALAMLALGGLALPAMAQDFYRGKTINLIVGNAAGGGYDIYARLLARYMGRYIPGEPSFVVRNMPGAGGMVLTNHIYSQATRDGLTLGMMSRNNPIEPLLGNASAKYKAEEFFWLGTPSSYENDSYCIIIRADSPVRSIADLKTGGHTLRLGGLAAGGSDTDLVLIARDVLKLNIQLIRGYRGTQELNLAIQRGEVEGRGIGVTSVANTFTDWHREGKLRFLLQFGHETRWKGLPDVPTARELATTPEDKALFEVAELPFLMARPFFGPPEVPAAQAAILRKAFMDTQKDPDYLREAAQMKIDISPLSGDDIAKIVTRIAQTSPAVVARYNAILHSK
jgi:tripartite-type tricarboxylate transporter receptor subunit TctC